MANISASEYLRLLSQSPTNVNIPANRIDPLLSFKWICTYLPFGLDPSYVESVDLPFSNISIADGWMGAATYTYYPSFSNISTFSLTIYEDSVMSTLQWITFWKNQISFIYPGVASPANDVGQSVGKAATVITGGGANGCYFMPSMYKRNIIFQLLDTTNSPVMNVTLQGVWPSDTSNLSLDYSGSERVKISQTFSCDGQSLEFLKAAAKNMQALPVAQAATSGANAVASSQTLETKVVFSSSPSKPSSSISTFLNSGY